MIQTAESSRPAQPQPPGIFDHHLGTRFEAVSPDGEPVEVLELKEQLCGIPSFEFALRKRVNTLTGFKDPSFATARGVRLGGGLAIVSDRVRGTRLSTVLEAFENDLIPLEFNAAVCVLRQLVAAVAVLHETMPDVCHGAIAPERIVVTPEGRVVIVEHMLASALEALHYSDQQYWDELRIAVPKAAGPACFDQRSDVLQIGLVALAMIHARSLNQEDYPINAQSLAERAWAATASGSLEPLPAALRTWLSKTLQLEPKQGFGTATAVWSELKPALARSNQAAELNALKAALARYGFDVLPPLPVAPPKPAPAASAPTPEPSSDPWATPAPSKAVAPAPMAAAPAPTPAAPAPTFTLPREVMPIPAAAQPRTPISPATPVRTPMPPAAKIPVVKTPVVSAPVATSIQRSPNAPAPPKHHVAPLPPTLPPTPPPAPPAPTPAKPMRVAAAVPAAAPQSDSGPITQSMRIRDVNQPAPRFAAQDEQDMNHKTHNAPWWRSRAVAAAVVVAVLGGAAFAGRSFLEPAADAAVPGTLVVNTDPPGVGVMLDGKRSGQTPVTLEVSAGEHVLTLLTEGNPRTIPVTLRAGATLSQFFEVPKVVAQTGQIQIRTEPSGARVVIDGTSRGNAPMTIEGLAVGAHSVELTNDSGSVRQEIIVAAGTTSSLVVPMSTTPRDALSGFISIAAPVDVQVFEDSRLVGSSRSDRLMVSVGRHDLDIVNEALGYRQKRTVNVTAGQVSAIRLDWPNGSMALNAQPWAEVFIDGERVGETPIGNVPVPIGPHEVVFKHPELGEQTVRSTVTLGSPARLSVDLRKK